MPDPLHWLGVTKIHRFISMSDMKVREGGRKGGRKGGKDKIHRFICMSDMKVRGGGREGGREGEREGMTGKKPNHE